MKKQNQFKPFDKILVRDSDQSNWKVGIFSHYDEKSNTYVCVGSYYTQCIPYNEETQHLIGTCKPYQPKVKETTYKVTYGFGNTLTCIPYTEEEFKNFINIAVCNNKDIKDFTVNVIIPD